MRSVFFVPPLNNMSGGLSNIYDLAELLAECGHEVALCHMDKGAPGLEGIDLPRLAWNGLKLSKNDLWCVPEGWPSVLAPGADMGARCVVYAQNWVSLLGVLPGQIRWKQLPAEYVAVSGPVAWFMCEVLDLAVTRVLPPVVRECFFRGGARPSGRVRLAWMPRKNNAYSKQIIMVAEERLGREAPGLRLEKVELHNLAQDEVARQLSSCHIFVMSSLAEGFGLPPVEAMASGCIPVGFAGLGGWEYMRSTPLSPTHQQVITSLPPGLTLPDRPWGPNGFYAPEGDVVSAGIALAAAIQLAAQNGQEWQALQAEAAKTAQSFSREAMRRRLGAVWNWK